MSESKFKGNYGESSNGNFKVIDTIGVPHPYMITNKHVCWAADHHMGMLDTYAIESAEKQGIKCGMRGCNLTYAEHEQALIVECHQELQLNGKTNPELHEYLLSIKDECESNGYAGFAFMKAEE